MIFYFSATGNCKYVADRVAAATGERCISVTACMQTQQLAFVPAEGEAVGVVAPVYFWGLPSIVKEFLQRVQLGRPAYLWFAATYGTTSGQAGHFAAEYLQKKGLALDARCSASTWLPKRRLTNSSAISGAVTAAILCAARCRCLPCAFTIRTMTGCAARRISLSAMRALAAACAREIVRPPPSSCAAVSRFG